MTRPAARDDGPPAVMVPTWTLGDRFRKIRRTTGIGQREFAEMLGTNSKTYAAWELDNTSPRDVVSLAKRIEALTGISAAWTLGIAPTDPNGSVMNHGSNSGNPHGNVVDLARHRHASGPIDQAEAA